MKGNIHLTSLKVSLTLKTSLRYDICSHYLAIYGTNDYMMF